MNRSARDKILKSWVGISEETLIKEVATKGDPTLIQLCKEHWARKRKLTLQEYEPFFEDVITGYARRLLNEHLILKAESVLRNVQRVVKCFFFEFACESTDVELREEIFAHLRRKNSLDTELQELQFYWQLLQQLQSFPELCTPLRRLDLEALMTSDQATRASLIAALFCTNRDFTLLPHLQKRYLWQFLVDQQEVAQLVRWCYLSAAQHPEDAAHLDALEKAYTEWPLETEMIAYALKNLSSPGVALRNCFVSAGHFFDDERYSAQLVLARICSTGSYASNRELLEKLPLGRQLLQRGCHALLLHDFVSVRELEEIATYQPEDATALQVVIMLKQNEPLERKGFQQLLLVVKAYLEDCGIDFQQQQPLVTLHEFLCHEPNVAEFHCLLHAHPTLKNMTYLQALAQLRDCGGIPPPDAHALLRRFKHIDFSLITKRTTAPDVASFSNARLREHYARRYPRNYMHYLQQERSAYAVFYLLTDLLQKYAQITPAPLYSACQMATELALQQSGGAPLLAHCVAFCELLGFDTQNLRCFLRLWRIFYKDDNVTTSQPPRCAFLSAKVERTLLFQLQNEHNDNNNNDNNNSIAFPLADYQALMRLVSAEQRTWPQLLLQWYAQQNDWWRLIVLLQYFEVPLSQLRPLCAHFENRIMGENILRALSHETPAGAILTEGKRLRSYSRQHSMGRSRRIDQSVSFSKLT